VRGGLNNDDAVAISKMLDAGGIDGIITSGGTSTMNPMIMFRGDSALQPMIKVEKNPLMKLILRLVGPSMFRQYPYKEMYFLEAAKRIKAEVNCAVVYVGGASCNESFEQLMAEDMDFIQLGRSLLSDADLPNKAQTEHRYQSRCLHCNECIATIEHIDGIHCTRFNPV
jgi:2,4-dienoyl-CoA reductase-like NADH-dependent reductase (Old Yellow Enzyme family)